MAGKRIGVMWRGKKEGKAVASGYIDLCGVPIRISLCKNDDKHKTADSPNYHVVSYGLDKKAIPAGSDSGSGPAGEQSGDSATAGSEDDLPF